jgi:hypothetical protein
MPLPLAWLRDVVSSVRQHAAEERSLLRPEEERSCAQPLRHEGRGALQHRLSHGAQANIPQGTTLAHRALLVVRGVPQKPLAFLTVAVNEQRSTAAVRKPGSPLLFWC